MSSRVGVPTKEDWVKSTFHHLHRNGSWCGRLHAHKLLVISRLLKQASPPFEFTLYQYGPYSFDLDSQVAEMEAFGELTCDFRRPGYGPSYSIVDDECEGVDSLDDAVFSGLSVVADQIGSLSGKDLELISTCLWAQIEEGLTDDDAIVERVHTLKPRFEQTEIRSALRRAQELQQRFSGS